MKFLEFVSVFISLSLVFNLSAKDSVAYSSSISECDDNENLRLSLTIPGISGFNPTTDTLDLTDNNARLVHVAFYDATPDDEFILNIQPVDFEGVFEYYGTVSMYVNYEGTSSFPYQIEECIGQTYFSIDFILEDNSCEVPQIDTLRLTMTDRVSSNNLVEIFTPDNSLELEGGNPEKLSFEITDIDNDEIDMWLALDDSASVAGKGFTLEIEEKASGKVSGYIHWDAECKSNSFLENELLRLALFANDLDACDEGTPVIHWIDVEIIWPVNPPPTLIASKVNHEVFVGSQFNFSLIVEDFDGDDTIIGIEGPEFGTSDLQAQIEIVDVASAKQVRFDWEPSCEAFLEGNHYQYVIWAQDDYCQQTRFDSVRLTINLLENRSSFDAFEPANVFTPNGDGINEYFVLSGHSDTRRNLPDNTCLDQFELFSVYNASGQSVFESTDRNFKWDAAGFSSGTYFYSIEYSETRFKGFFTVLK